jgi:hypothetical protein
MYIMTALPQSSKQLAVSICWNDLQIYNSTVCFSSVVTIVKPMEVISMFKIIHLSECV